jgi:VWFA-related protein
MAAFRYDSTVNQLSDFTSNPAAIEESLVVINDIAKMRPTEAADILGEKGPRFLRSVLNVLSTGHERDVNPRSDGVLHDAIHAAATALEQQPMDHRKMIVLVSDGRVVGNTAHTFDQNKSLLMQNQIQVYGVSAAFETFGSFKMLGDYAAATGGDVYPGTSTQSVESAFSRIVEQARYEYVLGYVSSNRAEQATFRTITIKTRQGKFKINHRRGYTQYPMP